MAVDEAILEASARRDVLPTLRLYAWHPACLSLGYAQPIADVDQQALAALGWDLVRRPTGGRAILHVNELTYSVSGPQSEPRLAGGVLESYRLLSLALLRALSLLGIPAQALDKPGTAASAQTSANRPQGTTDRESTHNQNPVCFEVPSNYEITVQGKKLIGSAQARRKGGVLQHGSLPLCGDLARITWALAFHTPAQREGAAQRLLARATTIEAVLGEPLSWGAAAQAFARAFAEALSLQFEESSLLPEELVRAEELLEEKYANPQWTTRLA